MNEKELRIILTNLYKNKISPADAIKKLQNMPYENIDFAKIDHHRELRSGLPEVIYGQDKSCLLYTSPSPRDTERSRMPSSA